MTEPIAVDVPAKPAAPRPSSLPAALAGAAVVGAAAAGLPVPLPAVLPKIDTPTSGSAPPAATMAGVLSRFTKRQLAIGASAALSLVAGIGAVRLMFPAKENPPAPAQEISRAPEPPTKAPAVPVKTPEPTPTPILIPDAPLLSPHTIPVAPVSPPAAPSGARPNGTITPVGGPLAPPAAVLEPTPTYVPPAPAYVPPAAPTYTPPAAPGVVPPVLPNFDLPPIPSVIPASGRDQPTPPATGGAPPIPPLPTAPAGPVSPSPLPAAPMGAPSIPQPMDLVPTIPPTPLSPPSSPAVPVAPTSPPTAPMLPPAPSGSGLPPIPAGPSVAPTAPAMPPAVPNVFPGIDSQPKSDGRPLIPDPVFPGVPGVPAAITKPAGTSDARPAAGGPAPKTSFDVDLYDPKATDTYETISQEYYNDRKFAPALRAFNENQPLQGGRYVQVPPIHILKKRFPGQTGGVVTPVGGTAGAPTSAGPDWNRAEPVPARATGTNDRGVYTVPPGGQTMKTIARTKLGSEQRWADIWELNRQFTDPSQVLPVGTELKLPPDAR